MVAKLKTVDIPPDVIAEFKHHQLGTWVAQLSFEQSGQRGTQSDNKVLLGSPGRRPRPYMPRVVIVLEPKPKI